MRASPTTSTIDGGAGHVRSLESRSAYDGLKTRLQLWAISQGASTWLIDLQPYEPCRVAGIALRWRIDPKGAQITATLFDGTAELIAQWPSVTLPSPLQATSNNRGLVLNGIASIGPDGELVMVDPGFSRVEFALIA